MIHYFDFEQHASPEAAGKPQQKVLHRTPVGPWRILTCTSAFIPGKFFTAIFHEKVTADVFSRLSGSYHEASILHYEIVEMILENNETFIAELKKHLPPELQ